MKEFIFNKLGKNYYEVIHKSTGKDYEVGTENGSWWTERGVPTNKSFSSKFELLQYLKQISEESKAQEQAQYDSAKWGVFLDGESEPFAVFDDKSEARRTLNKQMSIKNVDGYIDEIKSSKPIKKFGVKASAKAKRIAKSRITAAESDGLERAKQYIVDAYNNENWDSEDKTVDEYFKNEDLHKVGLVYTTLGDNDEYDYQISVDLIDPKVIVEIDGDVVYEDKYSNIDALADDLADFDWNNWYSYYIHKLPKEYDEVIFSSCANGAKPIKATTDAKSYYQITDDYYNVIDVADTEEKATALAEKILRESNEDHYDIWYVDETEDSDSDDVFITTIYADKPFIVEGYYESNFRGLADSDEFYELSDAIDYAHELLSKGDFVTMECVGGAGGTLRISPDEYFEHFDGEFACTPEIAEWQNAVWRSMGIGASKDIKCSTETIYTLNGFDKSDNMVAQDLVYKKSDIAKSAKDLFDDPDVEVIELFENDDYILDISRSTYESTGEILPEADMDWADYDYDNEYSDPTDFARDEFDKFINSAIAVGDDSRHDFSNPIYELDDYVKSLADGVVNQIQGITYDISKETIAFFDDDNNVVFVQPIGGIIPEPDDLETDIDELSAAIKSEMDNAYARVNWESEEDDPDYASRAVQLSEDIGEVDIDDLEPITGDGDDEDIDYGFGFDSNGEALDESTVEELYRIAEYEILPKSELAKIDEYVSIDEDSWDFYMSSPHVTEKFYIHFKLTEKNIDFNKYALPEATAFPDFNYYTAVLDFDIYTENGEITSVVLEEVKINRPDGAFDDYDVNRFDKLYNVDAIINYVEALAADTVMDIYNGTTNL